MEKTVMPMTEQILLYSIVKMELSWIQRDNGENLCWIRFLLPTLIYEQTDTTIPQVHEYYLCRFHQVTAHMHFKHGISLSDCQDLSK
jgi:hypothetical protein